MTVGQRHLLEKFSGGDRPLNRAIAAALHEIDRLRGEAARKAVPLDAVSSQFEGFDEEDERCPDCGHGTCVCDDPDYRCRSCGRLSDCIDNGLCGMCFELQGGVLLPGQ